MQRFKANYYRTYGVHSCRLLLNVSFECEFINLSVNTFSSGVGPMSPTMPATIPETLSTLTIEATKSSSLGNLPLTISWQNDEWISYSGSVAMLSVRNNCPTGQTFHSHDRTFHPVIIEHYLQSKPQRLNRTAQRMDQRDVAHEK